MSKMVNIQVSTLTERKTVLIEDSATVEQVLNEAGIGMTDGTVLNLNGKPAILSDQISSFNVDEGKSIFLTAVVNSKNA